MEDLRVVLDYAIELHEKFSGEWKDLGYDINYKKKVISDIGNEGLLYDSIFHYGLFINKNYSPFSKFSHLPINSSRVEFRIKKQNSIEDKIKRYVKKEQKIGGLGIGKCLNDLFGVRLILSKQHSFDEIKSFVAENYPTLKCIDSSKDEYIATHIYLKIDNRSLQWEVQVWNKCDEENNKDSHKKYKQWYAKWESGLMEGEF